MKTEELLRYEAEYRAMQEAFGTFLLVFDFPKTPCRLKPVGAMAELRSAWNCPYSNKHMFPDTNEPQLKTSPQPKQ
jgi:hypothetical protein